MVSLEVLFLTVPLKELVVLGGTVSICLTVLPSDIIFQPSFRCSSTFWMKLTDFASCIGVQTCAWWVPVREYPFGRIATVYLKDAMPPKVVGEITP
jgi:hypothetical protein